MTLLIGFVLGVLGSLLASFLFSWISFALPPRQQHSFRAFLRNPRLFLRLLRDSDERRVKARITALFDAWEKKDLQAYMACWADDAVRLIGTTSAVEERAEAIADSFRTSCKRYSEIRVAFALEDVFLGPRPGTAIAQVFYRFSLTRASDSLPVFEESREVYALRDVGGTWLIASNIDHFYEIRPSKPT